MFTLTGINNDRGFTMFSSRPRSAESVLKPLREIPMFAGLSNSVLSKFDSLMVELALDAGARLTTEGERGREAFIVAEGVAQVLVDGQVVGTVGSGDVVGELALLSGGTRTATVVAVTDMRVYVLDPREFSELLSDAHTAEWITSAAAGRLRELDAAS